MSLLHKKSRLREVAAALTNNTLLLVHAGLSGDRNKVFRILANRNTAFHRLEDLRHDPEGLVAELDAEFDRGFRAALAVLYLHAAAMRESEDMGDGMTPSVQKILQEAAFVPISAHIEVVAETLEYIYKEYAAWVHREVPPGFGPEDFD